MSQRLIHLPHRSLLRLHGPDTKVFLQGLITNDINKLSTKNGIAAFLLNTKGRIVEDVFLWRRGTDDIFLESSKDNQKNLIKEITKYKLRKKVEFAECEESVSFLENPEENHEHIDPRWSKFGARVFGSAKDEKNDFNIYENLRRKAGIAEGSAELNDFLPFQANADLLNMVSLDKGCYIGQELTARTAHTGVIRRRILPFVVGDIVAAGSDIVDEKGNKVGKIISSDKTNALGVLQLSSFNTTNLKSNNVPVKPIQPEWMPDKILLNSKTRTSLTDP